MENRTDHCIRVFFTTYGNYRKPALYSSGFQKSPFRAMKKLFHCTKRPIIHYEKAFSALQNRLFRSAKKIHTTSQGKTNRNLLTI